MAGLRGSDLVVTRLKRRRSDGGGTGRSPRATGRRATAPPSDELDRLVEGAASLYAKSPDAVRRTIVAAASPAITAFADAFRLRKD